MISDRYHTRPTSKIVLVLLLIAGLAPISEPALSQTASTDTTYSDTTTTYSGASSDTEMEAQEDDPSFWQTMGFFLYANGGYTARFNNYYSRSLFTSIGGNAPVKYTSRMLGIMDLNLETGIFNRRIINFSYQLGLPANEFQQEALAVQENDREGLERYTFGINAGPVVQSLLPDESVFSKIAQQLLSAEFLSIRELAQTTANVQKNALYLNSNSTINYRQQTAGNVQQLTEASSFTFKTKYRYNHITLPVIPVWNNSKFKDVLRVGIAQYSYDRPYQTDYFNLNNQPVLFDGSVETTALIWEITTKPLEPDTRKGLFFYFRQGVGLANTFKTKAFDWKQALDPTNSDERKIHINHYNTSLDLWYKLPVMPESSSLQITIKPGVSINSFITLVRELSERKEEAETINNIRKVDFFLLPWTRLEIGI